MTSKDATLTNPFQPLSTTPRSLEALLRQRALCGGTLETAVDAEAHTWTVRLRRADGTVYTLSHGHWWDTQTQEDIKAAEERIARLWQATRERRGSQ